MDRMPIQTYVMEYSEEMVREAISRELARGGQVYYVYNRVSNIADIAGKSLSWCRRHPVAFAHGLMHERELEKVMYGLSAVISKCWFPPPSSKRGWIFPMSIP